MIGSDGARRRTCFATRWVKSGLSMMTRRSGLAATTASAVRRIRVTIAGRLARTAVKPITAMSASGNRLATPSRAMACPPTPPKRTRSGPRRVFSARISFAPSWSPDSSPATIHTVTGSAAFMVIHPREVDGGEEQTELVGCPERVGLVQQQARAGADRDAGQAGLRSLDDRARPDRRHVDAKV